MTFFNNITPARIQAVAGIIIFSLFIYNVVMHDHKLRTTKQEVCVGNCPPPGPMDCTIYGRKKDGSWPSGYECSSTP